MEIFYDEFDCTRDSDSVIFQGYIHLQLSKQRQSGENTGAQLIHLKIRKFIENKMRRIIKHHIYFISRKTFLANALTWTHSMSSTVNRQLNTSDETRLIAG